MPERVDHPTENFVIYQRAHEWIFRVDSSEGLSAPPGQDLNFGGEWQLKQSDPSRSMVLVLKGRSPSDPDNTARFTLELRARENFELIQVELRNATYVHAWATLNRTFRQAIFVLYSSSSAGPPRDAVSVQRYLRGEG